MMPRSRRGFQAAGPSGAPERVRTHLLFSSQAEHHTAKRKRRPHNKFHQMMHKKDEMTTANPDELDPSQWTGNQRVLHFGPMAQRDPFFYYYPKGWDVLYPAQFGFFPYRTNKFRGSSTTVCVWAFGLFLVMGGAFMIYLGYFAQYDKPFWEWPVWTSPNASGEFKFPPPIQIAGPILFVIGAFLVLIGLITSLMTSQFLNERLRHYHHGGQPASVTVYTIHTQQPRAAYVPDPYQPLPPPAYHVVSNRHAVSNVVDPQAEMKLYPPVVPGYSTLSLHGRSPSVFMGSPYNTLRTVSMPRVTAPTSQTDDLGTTFTNYRADSVVAPVNNSRRQSSIISLTASQRRAKSLGAHSSRNRRRQESVFE
uniref:PIG-P domain-containing protein n=2 Tax=Panagrellus redivivus TaxID=6233 RepID=A0A7E4V299_PANRE